MKVSILTRDESPESREATRLGEDLSAEGYLVTQLEWEAEDSQGLIELYDIYSAPAVLVTTDNGVYIELWQGSVPALSEVRYKAGNV